MNIGADHYMEAKLLVPRYRRVERASAGLRPVNLMPALPADTTGAKPALMAELRMPWLCERAGGPDPA